MKRRPEGGHKLPGEAGWGSTGAAGRKPSAHPPPATIACPARSPSASATGSVPPVPMFHPGAGRLGARGGRAGGRGALCVLLPRPPPRTPRQLGPWERGRMGSARPEAPPRVSHHADGWHPTNGVPCSSYPILVCPFLARLTFCVTGRKATLWTPYGHHFTDTVAVTEFKSSSKGHPARAAGRGLELVLR